MAKKVFLKILAFKKCFFRLHKISNDFILKDDFRKNLTVLIPGNVGCGLLWMIWWPTEISLEAFEDIWGIVLMEGADAGLAEYVDVTAVP